mgnify:CR=1 FL=1
MTINNVSFGAKINTIPKLEKIAGKRKTLPEIKLEGYTAMIGCDVFTPSCKIEKHDLLFKDKKLFAIDDFDEENVKAPINYILLNGKTVAPAIFDEHIHGGYGVSFHDSGEQEIRTLLKKLANNGTGAVLATTLPGSAEQIKKQIQILNNIIKNPDEYAAKIIGIHLEGPFLNKEKKGIHSIRDLMPPTIENYKSFEPENIKMVTLAPELDVNYELTKYLQKRGVIVSAGHSIAAAKDIIDSGIKHVTHLFNAMAPLHHRIPTIANEGLTNPNVTAEMIADEASIIPEIMNMTMKIKPKDKFVLISDALPNAGIKEDFIMNNKMIHVDENWVPRDADGTLAGTMKFLPEVAKKLIEDTCMTFRNFIRFASVNPAKTFGFLEKFTLKKGLSPIFSIWDNAKMIPEKTFVNND